MFSTINSELKCSGRKHSQKFAKILFFCIEDNSLATVLFALSSARSISSNSVQSGHFLFTPGETHCLDLFSTVLRQMVLGLPWFLFLWVVYLRATIGILLWDILKIFSRNRRRHLLIFVWIARNLIWRANLWWSWARKPDRSCVSIHCEIPQSYGNPFKQLIIIPICAKAPLKRYCYKDGVWFTCYCRLF